ncbi:hypothetical protein CLOM_g8859 [Closterium sp. NIES-68]|nr:hypothetical protein CLOM_g8859 [Closterium sp. NIES-68]
MSPTTATGLSASGPFPPAYANIGMQQQQQNPPSVSTPGFIDWHLQRNNNKHSQQHNNRQQHNHRFQHSQSHRRSVE